MIIVRTLLFLTLAIGISTPSSAEQVSLSIIISWQGKGQVFAVAPRRLRFLGAIEGIMYVETTSGDMDEAFVRCPIVEEISADDRASAGTGSCEISVAPGDTLFASMRCRGRPGACRGEFELIGGTGRFEGVQGRGQMTVRSAIHTLAADLSEGTVLDIGAGLIQIPALAVDLPTSAIPNGARQ
ncbi:MAG: hypothetical protein AAGA68_13935 [Pseudomonadota bacterium]